MSLCPRVEGPDDLQPFVATFFSRQSHPHALDYLLPWTVDGFAGYENEQPSESSLSDALGMSADFSRELDRTSTKSSPDLATGNGGPPRVDIRILYVPIRTIQSRYVLGHVYEQKYEHLQYRQTGKEPSDTDILTNRFWIDLKQMGRVLACLVRADLTVKMTVSDYVEQGVLATSIALKAKAVAVGALPTKLLSMVQISQRCPYCVIRGTECNCPPTLLVRSLGQLPAAESFADLGQAVERPYDLTTPFHHLSMKCSSQCSTGFETTSYVLQHMFGQTAIAVGPSCKDYTSMKRKYRSMFLASDVAKKNFFVCHMCERSFSQKVHMQKHVDVVHLQLKPYSCHLCGANFGTQSNLDRHRRNQHHMQRNVKCPSCSKTCFTPEDLASHLDRHHGS